MDKLVKIILVLVLKVKFSAIIHVYLELAVLTLNAPVDKPVRVISVIVLKDKSSVTVPV